MLSTPTFGIKYQSAVPRTAGSGGDDATTTHHQQQPTTGLLRAAADHCRCHDGGAGRRGGATAGEVRPRGELKVCADLWRRQETWETRDTAVA